MKSSRVGRVVRILTALQAGRSYTCADLARMFGKSRRTIFRDLQQLQSIGIPYHYDSKTGGYRIDSQFFLPPIGLNLSEALSLLLLVHKARCQIQLPFGNSALLAALKIESKLPAEIRRYCNASLRNISTRPNPQAPTNLLDRIFSQIQRAIIRRRCLAMSYRSLFEGSVIDLELHPYHLMYNRRAWYVLGYSVLHKSIRTFKLNRIKDVKMLEKCFTDGGGFDLSEFLGCAWSMIPEGRLYDIKLKFL